MERQINSSFPRGDIEEASKDIGSKVLILMQRADCGEGLLNKESWCTEVT